MPEDKPIPPGSTCRDCEAFWTCCQAVSEPIDTRTECLYPPGYFVDVQRTHSRRLVETYQQAEV